MLEISLNNPPEQRRPEEESLIHRPLVPIGMVFVWDLSVLPPGWSRVSTPVAATAIAPEWIPLPW